MSENKMTFVQRGAQEPTDLHKTFAAWLEKETGVKVDLKSVQLATSLRMDFQRSETNQANLKARKSMAAAKAEAAAAAKKARLQAQLEKINKQLEGGTETKVKANPEGVEIVYGVSGGYEVHALGCGDVKRALAKSDHDSAETVMGVTQHDEVLAVIYDDHLSSGECTLASIHNGEQENFKPCADFLGSDSIDEPYPLTAKAVEEDQKEIDPKEDFDSELVEEEVEDDEVEENTEERPEMQEKDGEYVTAEPIRSEQGVQIRRGKYKYTATIQTFGEFGGKGEVSWAIYEDSKGKSHEIKTFKRV